MTQVIHTAKGVTVTVSAIDASTPPVAAAFPGPVTFVPANIENITATASADATSVVLVPTDPTKAASIDVSFMSGNLSVSDHFVYSPPAPVAAALVLTVVQNT